MTDSKISDLTQVSAVTDDTIFGGMSDDGGGSYSNARYTANDVRDVLLPDGLHGRTTPHANDDEFDDATVDSAWAVVEDTSPNITVSEGRGCMSVYHPGGDSNEEFHGIVKPISPAGSFRIETCMSWMQDKNDFCIAGLVASDGNSYGSGDQISNSPVWCQADTDSQHCLREIGNWNSHVALSSYDEYYVIGGPVYMRLEYDSGTNTWTGDWSPDGHQWGLQQETLSKTMSATHLGFAMSTWGSSGAGMQLSFEYFRYDDL